MPFCSRAELQGWLDEFEAGGAGRGRPYVAEQEATEGRDSGLVIHPLDSAGLSVYIQPTVEGSFDWCVTIEAHPEDTTAETRRLRQLCQELSRAALLCDFLQSKALALALEQSGARAEDDGGAQSGTL